jgi:hypothetical protein
MTSRRKEPLLHFLLLGALLFAIHTWAGDRGRGTNRNEIVVTAGRVRSLTETFTRQWNRPPSPDELAGLVRDFVREEVLMREALALGLDRYDTIVRRRLAQKMEFLSDDLAAVGEPTAEALRAHLAEHPERFRVDPRFTFSQIHLDREKRGNALAADAAKLLGDLNAPDAAPNLDALGDSRLLDARYVNVSAREIDAQFGAAFAARLDTLPHGRWEGPIESGYGAHLVRIEAFTPGRLPALEEVRDRVAQEWTAARRSAAQEAHLQALLARYEVTVEPEAASALSNERLAEAKK